MSVFKLEQLEECLNHDSISWNYVKKEGQGFSRKIEFSVDGQKYEITWYKNYSTLKSGNLVCMFTNVKQSNTWPNEAKLNLQFNLYGETSAVIPIEDY